MSKDKVKDAVARAREISDALNAAKDSNGAKAKRGQYAHVRALRRGDASPTFASTPMKDVGEDEGDPISRG